MVVSLIKVISICHESNYKLSDLFTQLLLFFVMINKCPLVLVIGHMQAKNNTPAAQEKCITRLLLYHFCVNLPLMMASYPVFRAMGMRSSFPLPSWYYQVL